MTNLLEKALLDGYATSDINVVTMFVAILLTAAIGTYIMFIYKAMNKNSFYNPTFALSLVGLGVITAAVILTIQSNIVVSLGMVGALSIVRFRTAIKDPLDLVFLFWSISVGIICGAGFGMIAIIASIVLTIIIILFAYQPVAKETLMLVVNSNDFKEEEVLSVVKKQCSYYKVRARNLSGSNCNMAIEVKVKHPHKLIIALQDSKLVTSISLLEHDGNITV